jgi:methylmalonyl-CoA/ethylmalonyl-CoA epimerase
MIAGADSMTKPPTTLGAIFAGGLFQVGYVFPKAATALDDLRALLCAGEFTQFKDAPVHTQYYRGQPMESRQNLAFGFAGPLNIEVVEPVAGVNIYSSFLDENRAGGLHHLAWKVSDMNLAIEAMLAAGHQQVQSGCFGVATRFGTDRITSPWHWESGGFCEVARRPSTKSQRLRLLVLRLVE